MGQRRGGELQGKRKLVGGSGGQANGRVGGGRF